MTRADKNPLIATGKRSGVRRVDRIVSDKAAEGPIQLKRVKNYKRHAKKVIASRFAGIMEALADKSMMGSLGHTKYLFELGGVKEDIELQSAGKPEPTLADLLLAEIRRNRQPEEAVTSKDARSVLEDGTETTSADTAQRGGDCGVEAQ